MGTPWATTSARTASSPPRTGPSIRPRRPRSATSAPPTASSASTAGRWGASGTPWPPRNGRAALGPEHTSVATTLHNLGNAMAAAGAGADAARCHWRALELWSRALGPAHPDSNVAATLHSLGNVYRGLGEPEAAAACFGGALRIREAALGATHPETARTRHCAALVGCQRGDAPAALQELQAAVNSLLAGLGAEHPWSRQACADAEGLREVVRSAR
ncbi:unnamed protein product [Prorocentrum cordatum]|uniref:Kinesin light chain n=1 Tax=Prorocentrum cordatum TaxID=2364126 RepID=A0ABN9VKT3_9DINO|nr:unnamed protein product [Polarella glacialis]